PYHSMSASSLSTQRRPPPSSPLFPYTTLFRSSCDSRSRHGLHGRRVVPVDDESVAVLQRNPRRRRFVGAPLDGRWTVRRHVLPIDRSQIGRASCRHSVTHSSLCKS